MGGGSRGENSRISQGKDKLQKYKEIKKNVVMYSMLYGWAIIFDSHSEARARARHEEGLWACTNCLSFLSETPSWLIQMKRPLRWAQTSVTQKPPFQLCCALEKLTRFGGRGRNTTLSVSPPPSTLQLSLGFTYSTSKFPEFCFTVHYSG